jgi:hypothetical protein
MLIPFRPTFRVLAMGGILPRTLIRSREFKVSKKVDTKPFAPPIANTMLAAVFVLRCVGQYCHTIQIYVNATNPN